MKKSRKIYNLQEGMVLVKEYYGKTHQLRVISANGIIKYKLDDKIFNSLTAAARHVLRDETRQVAGPEFWNAPLAAQ
jgi:hypothetical protein